jgi:hypothetical protein
MFCFANCHCFITSLTDTLKSCYNRKKAINAIHICHKSHWEISKLQIRALTFPLTNVSQFWSIRFFHLMIIVLGNKTGGLQCENGGVLRYTLLGVPYCKCPSEFWGNNCEIRKFMLMEIHEKHIWSLLTLLFISIR